MDFDREVNKIGRRKALAFFAKWLVVIGVLLYAGIAAHRYYVEHHPDPRDSFCSCDDCDCLPPEPRHD
jgi:hypothetical protein